MFHRFGFLKKERFWFYLLVLVFAWPAWVPTAFPTLDGPAHLHNVRLLQDLLSGSEFIKQHFVFNSVFLPNWIGHFILLIGSKLGGWLFAEKLVLAFYLLLFPIAGRQLIKVIKPENSWLSFAFLPMSYTHFFFLGFYNYSIATALLLLVIWYSLKHRKEDYTIRTALILALLLLVIYFSHLVICGIAVGIVLWFSVYDMLFKKDNPTNSKKKFLINLIISVPSLILITHFFLSRNSGAVAEYWSSQKLFNSLYIWPQFHMANDFEANLSLLPVKLLVLFGLLYFIWMYFRKNLNASYVTKSFWVIPILALGAYFVLPNTSTGAGFITPRFLGLFILFLFIWLSSIPYPSYTKYWSIAIIVLGLYGSNKLLHTYKRVYPLAASLIQLGEEIPEHSVIYPINSTNNWFTLHFSNYVGIHKPIVILENYEASVDYFPLRWKGNKFKAIFPSYLYEENQKGLTGSIVTHVLVIGDEQELPKEIQSMIHSEKLRLIDKSAHYSLYRF